MDGCGTNFFIRPARAKFGSPAKRAGERRPDMFSSMSAFSFVWCSFEESPLGGLWNEEQRTRNQKIGASPNAVSAARGLPDPKRRGGFSDRAADARVPDRAGRHESRRARPSAARIVYGSPQREPVQFRPGPVLPGPQKTRETKQGGADCIGSLICPFSLHMIACGLPHYCGRNGDQSSADQ